MQSPPAPCPAGQIPDATGIAAFSAAYEAARAVFVCIARSGQRWTVKADTFTTPTHVVDEVVAAAIREAAVRRQRGTIGGSQGRGEHALTFGLDARDRQGTEAGPRRGRSAGHCREAGTARGCGRIPISLFSGGCASTSAAWPQSGEHAEPVPLGRCRTPRDGAKWRGWPNDRDGAPQVTHPEGEHGT